MQCAQGETALQLSQNGEDYPLKADRGLKQAVSPSSSDSKCLSVAMHGTSLHGYPVAQDGTLLQLAC